MMPPHLLEQTHPTEAICIGADLRLSPCTPDQAKLLGAHFAGVEPWSRYPFSPTVLERYLAGVEPGAPRYAISSGGGLVGALGLRLNWLRGPYIQFLGVLPEAQASGIGSTVIAKLSEDARATGERNLWVAASAFNAAALRFYERQGFARAAEFDGLVQDGINEILLRKRL